MIVISYLSKRMVERYSVQRTDGLTCTVDVRYTNNSIVETLYAQIDDEGFDTGIMDEIVSHSVDHDIAIPISDDMIQLNNTMKPKCTTKGWDIHIKWKDSAYDWLPLSTVKEFYPIAVAEYAVANNLAFKWRV